MNIGKWVKTPKQVFILGKEIRPKDEWAKPIAERLKILAENDEEFNKKLEKWKKQNWEYNPLREKGDGEECQD